VYTGLNAYILCNSLSFFSSPKYLSPVEAVVGLEAVVYPVIGVDVGGAGVQVTDDDHVVGGEPGTTILYIFCPKKFSKKYSILSQNTAVDGQKYPSYVWYLHL
jgi:hypothetical protein